MADKFQCDHCGNTLPMTSKAGIVEIKRLKWVNGILFPPQPVHKHDLCTGCLDSLLIDINNAKRRLPEG